jgi:O-antigen/teichoic acid export membrane protein
MGGAQFIAGLIYLCSAGVFILAGLILIPRFGAAGAAIDSIVTVLFWVVWLNVYLRRKLGVTAAIVARSSA